MAIKIVPRSELDVFVAVSAALGESPMWDGRTDSLWWVDIDNHLLWRLGGSAKSPEQRDFGRPVSAVTPREGGGLAIGLHRQVALTDANLEISELIVVEDDEPGIRLNDGACDPAGRLWTGSMATDGRSGQGALYCLDRDHTVSEVISGVTISNGLGWSPDGQTMFHVDTGASEVKAYRYNCEDGTVNDPRLFAAFPPEAGRPDGLTVDSQGCIWIAFWGGGTVQCYTPQGDLERRICLPVSNVTSCCFGGRGLDELYITTARRGLSASQLAAEPDAGAVFVCRPGVSGLPTHRYAG